jgi:hypothetical protein
MYPVSVIKKAKEGKRGKDDQPFTKKNPPKRVFSSIVLLHEK